MFEIKDISIIMGILVSVSLLILRIWEAGKSDGMRKENMLNINKNLDAINNNITNNIPGMIQDLKTKIDELKDNHSNCRKEMGDRVSKLEGCKK